MGPVNVHILGGNAQDVGGFAHAEKPRASHARMPHDQYQRDGLSFQKVKITHDARGSKIQKVNNGLCVAPVFVGPFRDWKRGGLRGVSGDDFEVLARELRGIDIVQGGHELHGSPGAFRPVRRDMDEGGRGRPVGVLGRSDGATGQRAWVQMLP